MLAHPFLPISTLVVIAVITEIFVVIITWIMLTVVLVSIMCKRVFHHHTSLHMQRSKINLRSTVQPWCVLEWATPQTPVGQSGVWCFTVVYRRKEVHLRVRSRKRTSSCTVGMLYMIDKSSKQAQTVDMCIILTRHTTLMKNLSNYSSKRLQETWRLPNIHTKRDLSSFVMHSCTTAMMTVTKFTEGFYNVLSSCMKFL